MNTLPLTPAQQAEIRARWDAATPEERQAIRDLILSLDQSQAPIWEQMTAEERQQVREFVRSLDQAGSHGAA